MKIFSYLFFSSIGTFGQVSIGGKNRYIHFHIAQKIGTKAYHSIGFGITICRLILFSTCLSIPSQLFCQFLYIVHCSI